MENTRYKQLNKFYKRYVHKSFISLLVAVILVFSYQVNKPKAIVPILLWGGGILATVVAEELLEMGIKHVTADGKTKKRTKTAKVVDLILDDLGGYDFDNTNPTRKADGTLEVNLSANDRAKIARHIADEFGDVITDDETRNSSDDDDVYSNIELRAYDYANHSNYSTAPRYVMGKEFAKKLFDVSFEQVPNQNQVKIIWTSVINGYKFSKIVDGGYQYDYGGTFIETPGSEKFNLFISKRGYPPEIVGDPITGYSIDLRNTDPNVIAYITYLKVVQDYQKKIYYAGGLAVAETLKNVYSVGEGYNGTLPNNSDLSNKPFKIPNYFPSSSSDQDVTWEVVQNHHDTDVTNNQTKIDNEYETYLENGDLNKNTYNTQTINNYYTDTNYPVKNDDIKIDIDIDIVTPPPVVIDDGDDDGGSGTGGDVEEINRGILDRVRGAYDYLGDSVEVSVLAMRDITDDAEGIVNYLDESFDWLPSEWRAFFGSAFVLGVFAHFMRR